MSEMSFQQDYENGLKNYIARIGYQPGLPLPVIGGGIPLPSQVTDPINNLLYERSLNLPFVGEQTIGENVGLDDYARLNRAIAEGDTSQALSSAGTGLAEVGSLFVGGGLGTLGTKAALVGSKVLPNIFGKAAPAVASTAAKTAGSSSDSIIGRMMAESRAKAAGSVPSSAAPKPSYKGGWLNPRNLPKSGKIGLGVTAVGGILGALGLLGRDDTVPAQPFVPTVAPFSGVPGPDTTQQDIFKVLRDARARERRIIEGARDTALEGFGQVERDKLAEYLNTLDIAQRGQTAAIRGQYQDLYDRLAGDVAAIEGMGAAGAGQVNRRYRQAARRAQREGRREQVASGVGGLTPVSGALADMPANVRGQGRDLAAYLRNNAAVAARDAGFDAETSLEYGNAVANEFAQNIALMGAGQELALGLQLAAQERDLRSQYDAMLADLTRQGIATEADIAASEIARQREEAASRVTGTQLLADPELSVTIPAAWEKHRLILEGTPPEGTTTSDIEVAYSIGNALVARYGSADVNTYAQYLADAGAGG